jgi:hypothetical protein
MELGIIPWSIPFEKAKCIFPRLPSNYRPRLRRRLRCSAPSWTATIFSAESHCPRRCLLLSCSLRPFHCISFPEMPLPAVHMHTCYGRRDSHLKSDHFMPKSNHLPALKKNLKSYIFIEVKYKCRYIWVISSYYKKESKRNKKIFKAFKFIILSWYNLLVFERQPKKTKSSITMKVLS